MESHSVAADNPNTNFSLPVDSEHKATVFKAYYFAAPHMTAFHLSWISFFACFVSTFAAPPLLPIIRDDLDLTATDIGNAGIAAVSGAVLARVLMGTACDLIGPRLATVFLTLLTAPAVYLSSMADSSIGFLLVRFFTGFSLATFVSTQFWMSSMFSCSVVGTANGFAGGWGNLGGGATQLIMPLVFSLVCNLGATKFTAWRITFFIPALFQTLSAYAIFFFGKDLPDGNYSRLHESGARHKDNYRKVIYNAIRNYRGWILVITYGFCFGVELTIDNIIAQYFYDRFNLNLHTAGFIASSFGLMNLFSRPCGGILSDKLAKKFGMRGRLYALWIVQTIGGLLCVLLGRVKTLIGSVIVMILFSVFVQAACGLTFGIVPFVSRRSLGMISGLTGAGGNIGAIFTQLIFFRGSIFSTEKGITLMGVMIIILTIPITFIFFPQWGGMFCGPNGKTEEEYYMNEWNSEEKEQGFHLASLRFVENSRSERGNRVGSAHITDTNPAV